jgi:hypothetical protein
MCKNKRSTVRQDRGAYARRGGVEAAAELGQELVREGEGELSEALGDHVARALLLALRVLEQQRQDRPEVACEVLASLQVTTSKIVNAGGGRGGAAKFYKK